MASLQAAGRGALPVLQPDTSCRSAQATARGWSRSSPSLLLPRDAGTSASARRLAPAPEAFEDASDPQDGLAPPVRTEVSMARVTVEDCIGFVDNRFALCILATRRARQLAAGATPHVDAQRNKAAVVALREVATGRSVSKATSGKRSPDRLRPAECSRPRSARPRSTGPMVPTRFTAGSVETNRPACDQK